MKRFLIEKKTTIRQTTMNQAIFSSKLDSNGLNSNKETSSKSEISLSQNKEMKRDAKITKFFSNEKQPSQYPFKEEACYSKQSIPHYDLSDKTKAFLKKVKLRRPFKPEPKPAIQISLLESFSMREKYNNLLIRKLLLPVHYNNLLCHFIEVDKKLLSSKNKLRRSVKSVPASKEELLKMLFVFPNCFHFYPSANSPTVLLEADTETFSRRNLKKLREKRQQTFRNKLLQLVNNEHKTFLSKQGINFNPFKYNTWHSDFNLEKCPYIPIRSHHLFI